VTTAPGLVRLRDATVELVAAADDEQRRQLCLSFDDEDERRTWMYWPNPRQGLAFSAMDSEQCQLAYRVVAAALSVPALAKVTTIVGLEEVLRELEIGGQPRRRPDALPRDPSKYFTTVFGDPAGDGPWGWRFEGHHVSLHITVVDGELAATPLFLGANPAEVRHGDGIVLRPLAAEEDLARALVCALRDDQRRRALIDDQAPDDILTSNSPRVEAELDGGVAMLDLKGTSAALAEQLVRLYVERLNPALGAAPPSVDDLHFAWAGSTDRNERHYYRIAGPRFLVEWDNTQNEANHCHSVWRDPSNDFGDDLLRRHRAEHHQDG
jgi:hypothetical protein